MKNVAINNLSQLKQLIENISDEEYRNLSPVLSNSTIGQHIRHILEFYLLLIQGGKSGVISYDKRKRDIDIESKREKALSIITEICKELAFLNEDKSIHFEADYSTTGGKNKLIESSVGRELAYCIEHSIHHQAIIKAALIASNKQELTDENFGVAFSTIRYRQKTSVINSD